MSASSHSSERPHEDTSSLVWPFFLFLWVVSPRVLWFIVFSILGSCWASEFMKNRFLEADEKLRLELSGEHTPEKAVQSITTLCGVLKWVGFLLPIPIIPLCVIAGCYFEHEVEEAAGY